MYQSQSTYQRRIFLSISGESGRIASENLINQWIKAGYGSYLDFWTYPHNSKQGANLVGEYITQLYNSSFYVPILTSDFVEGNSKHIEEELNAAISVEHELKDMLNDDYKFIIPYSPEGLVDNARLPYLLRTRVIGDAIKTAETLYKAINRCEGSERFKNNVRSLDDWPNLFFDKGIPNVMFVLGHTEKEGKLITQRAESFRKWGFTDRDPESEGSSQSLRPAQMVPGLQRYIYNKWLSQQSDNQVSLPEMPCEIDRHLINYRYKMLGRYNLICLGAGDTNWISRIVQRHFREILLGVRFGEPDKSEAIIINTQDHEKGKTGKLILSEVKGQDKQEIRIKQVERNDDLFSALIIALPNPWNTKKSLLLCAGLTGLGTMAAMYAVMHPEFKERIKKRHLPHVVVIKGKEKDWLPIEYEVVL